MTKECTLKEAYIIKALDEIQPDWRDGKDVTRTTKDRIRQRIAEKYADIFDPDDSVCITFRSIEKTVTRIREKLEIKPSKIGGPKKENYSPVWVSSLDSSNPDDELGYSKLDRTMGGTFTEEEANEVVLARQAMEATIYSHSSLEYYTPKNIIESARELMGSIDTDPASCVFAQSWIKAKVYYTKENDGLSKEWKGNVWLNPPYSKTNGQSNQEIWSSKLLKEYKKGNVTSAVLLVKAALGYKWFEELWDSLPVCFARERLSFIFSDGKDDGQSKQATAFFYIGMDIETFKQIFGKYGRVLITC